MAQWECCQISNPQSGTDAVIFSKAQHPSIVQEYAAVLGRGLKAEQSTAQFLHLNLNYANTVMVAGMLGHQGWELVSHSVLTGGNDYWTFKRPMAGNRARPARSGAGRQTHTPLDPRVGVAAARMAHRRRNASRGGRTLGPCLD
jgi:hypothetical protein